MPKKRIWIAAIACAAVVPISGAILLLHFAFPQGSQLETVVGPEAPVLIERVRGTLALLDLRRGRSELLLVSLPDLAHRQVQLRRPASEVTGPDAAGRIVYSEDSTAFRLHETSVSDASNDHELLMLGEIDQQPRQLTLSARRSRVTWFSARALGGYQYAPATLNVFEIQTGERMVIGGSIFSHARPSWFPDGRSLALVRPVPIEELPDRLREPESEIRVIEGGPLIGQVLVTFVVDVDTREELPLCLGSNPVVSDDGRFVLTSTWHDQLVDARTGAVIRRGALPGACPHTGVIGLFEDGVAIYGALPTSGMDPIPLPRLFRLKGPGWAWTIKVGRLGGREFATVFGDVGFGCVAFSPNVLR